MNFKTLFLLITVATAIFSISLVSAAGESIGESDENDYNRIITVTASGDGSYYDGEEIRFSGTNKITDKTYLFVCGPELDKNGCKPDSLETMAISGVEDTFAKAEVSADGVWSYSLDTNKAGFLPGTYTIYAVTEPDNKQSLSKNTYDTVSIVIKKPFISAKLSKNSIKPGEKLTVTGNAEGNPSEIGIWVFGYDYYNGAESGSMVTVSPKDDSSYNYVLDESETENMKQGEYFVIVQHYMYDNKPGIITKTGDNGRTIFATKNEFLEQTSYPGLFAVYGDNALRGADASEALIEALNLPDVDDTYALCTFNVEKDELNNAKTNQDKTPNAFESLMNYLSGIFAF